MRIQFSTRTLLIATTVVGAMLGGLLLIRHLLSINPSSLEVEVCGKVTQLPWEDCEWEPGHAGIGGPFGLIHSDSMPRYEDIALDQKLVSIRYLSYLGTREYAGHIRIDGNRSDSWDQYRLQVMRTGGGNVDGAVAYQYTFDLDRKVLEMELRTWVNSKRIAKKCTLTFWYDGSSFVLQQ